MLPASPRVTTSGHIIWRAMAIVEISGAIEEELKARMLVAGHSDMCAFVEQVLALYLVDEKGGREALSSRVGSLEERLSPRIVSWGLEPGAALSEVGDAL